MTDKELRLSYDLELELNILSLCYQHQQKRMVEVAEEIRPKHFHHDDHRKLFERMLKIHADGGEIRTALIVDMGETPWELLLKIQENLLPANLEARTLCRRLVAHWMRNWLLRQSENFQIALQDRSRDPLELWTKFSSALEGLRSGQGPIEHLVSGEESAERVRDFFDAVFKEGRQPGLDTHLAELNDVVGAFQPGDLVVLAARPSVGKTALAGNFLAHLADTGRLSLFVSAEMSHEALTKRQLAKKAGVDGHRMAHAPQYLSKDERTRLFTAVPRTAWKNVYYYDPGLVYVRDLHWVMDSARHRMGGLDAVFVDYVQLLYIEEGRSTSSLKAYERVTMISKELKGLARRFNCTVFALSQLNRTAAGEEPQLHHLRDSGQIEQDADTVLMLWREEGKRDYEPDSFYLKVAKMRNGNTGKVPLFFDGSRLFFFDAKATPGPLGPTPREEAADDF